MHRSREQCLMTSSLRSDKVKAAPPKKRCYEAAGCKRTRVFASVLAETLNNFNPTCRCKQSEELCLQRPLARSGCWKGVSFSAHMPHRICSVNMSRGLGAHVASETATHCISESSRRLPAQATVGSAQCLAGSGQPCDRPCRSSPTCQARAFGSFPTPAPEADPQILSCNTRGLEPLLEVHGV